MITSLIFDILPVFFCRLGDIIKQSAIYSLLLRIYRYIYRLAHESIIGGILARHKNEGAIYESSFVCRALDKLNFAIVSIVKKVISGLSFGTNTSAIIGLFQRISARLGFIDFEFICGAAIFIMLLCPGNIWSNVYALILSAGLLIILVSLTAIGRREFLKIKTLGLPFVVFAFSTLVGVGIARNTAEALRVFIFFLSAFFFCIVIAGAVTDEKKLRKILGAIFISLVCTAVLGFVQRIMGVQVDASLTDLGANAGMPGRVFSTFENPNNYAEIIVLLFPLALAYCTMIKDRVYKLTAFALLCLPIGALLMTYSRSGWVSFALAAVVFIFFYNKKLLPVLLVLAVLAIPLLPATIYNRILTIGSTKDSSNMYRIYIWQGVLNLLDDNWLVGLGLGPGNFRPDYLTYCIRKAAPAPHSHMLYLEIWVEMGLMGILAYLSYYFTTIRKAIVNFKNSSKAIRVTLIAGVSALAGIAFVCSAEYIWFYPRVLFCFFILTGVITAAINISNKEKVK